MEDKENKDLIPLNDNIDLVAQTKEQDNKLIDEILQESDVDKLKDLTHLFNAFQTKRQILRVNTLNDVQDALVSQMMERLTKTPNNFNNQDLANWMKTVQQALDSTKHNIDSIDSLPTIVQQNNTQVNINVEDTLSRESREKILDAVKALLQSSEDIDETDVYNDENTESEIIDIDDETIDPENK